jgi:hypothetical protein
MEPCQLIKPMTWAIWLEASNPENCNFFYKKNQLLKSKIEKKNNNKKNQKKKIEIKRNKIKFERKTLRGWIILD